MTADPLDLLWTSPANRPSPAEAAALAEKFHRRLQRARRADLGLLLWATLLLAPSTILFLRHLVLNPQLHSSAEWAGWLALALPWVATVHLARKWLGARRQAPPSEAALTAHLHALVRANAAEQRKLRFIALLLAVLVPVMALCVVQLRATGKVAPRETSSLVTVLGGLLSLGAGSVAFAYFGRAKPEARRLAAWLRACE